MVVTKRLAREVEMKVIQSPATIAEARRTRYYVESTFHW